MRWDHLQFFLAVIEQGSLGSAARALRVNHSTVLRHLAGLEAQLGMRLFDRLPSGYVPTPQGRALAARLAGVTDLIEGARLHAGGSDLEVRGSVRLTVPDTLLHALLLPHLAAFREAHPGVQLELVVDNGFLSLARREADIAVRGAERPPETLVGRRVGTVRSALYASRGYLRGLGRGAGEDRWRWVVPDESLSQLASAAWVRRHVPDTRVALRSNSLLAIADAVAVGAGVGWVLEPLAVQRTSLVRLRDPVPAMDTPLWVLSHPGLRHVARVAVLARFLAERLLAEPVLQGKGAASPRTRNAAARRP